MSACRRDPQPHHGQVPLILISRRQDQEAEPFVPRDGSTRNGVPIAEAIELIKRAIADHRSVLNEADFA